MKRIIIIFILIAFISCRDKKNANNVAAESTDTEVAIATLKAFYSSVYNGSLDNREVLFKQYVSKQLLEKIDELSADMTLDYDPFIDGQDFFADVLNSTLKITPLENKNEYRCCFLLFGDTDEKETCIDLLLEKDKDGHFVISKILNDDILAGKRDVMPSDIQETTIDYKGLVQLLKLDCNASNKEEFYKLNCQNVRVANETEEGKNSVSEIITVTVGKNSRKIIRKTSDVLTSSPFVYFDEENKTYILLFPLVGEYNFVWELYCYKDNKIFSLGQRITYWKAEYEESKTTYGDFVKIYRSEGKYIVAMTKKYISAEHSEYNDYPDYLEGTLVKDKNMYYFEFPSTELPYYKKYMNGDKKGDYEEFLKNDFTTPKDIVITEEGIIQNDNGEMIQFKNITEVINQIQKSKLFTLKKMYQHDLNQDGDKDIFLVFKNNNDLKSDDDKTLVAPVILLIHQGGDKYKFFHNEKIYPSMEGFFFKRIAFKDNFFTIELNTEVPDEYTAEKYITFKYSKNKIVLHRFGDITYWWDERKPSNVQATQKDFGEILFEDYDPEKINEIIYESRKI
ncbi:DUF3828 domain-containing protein [Capnocytophaga sputigena]|uniref:DUF3828 domain-containing protein n=1 Tax=Capnocytophaga sputigena TaxID=1019 RepID=UPI0028D41FEE|nr:DUF3828 domain-containing protein [Capnocytophaga sputigena]